MTIIKKFEVGKSYFCRSACNYECVWTFKVIKRTDKTIVLYGSFIDGEKQKRLRIFSDNVTEWCMPMGHYSMAPALFASRRV